MEIKSYKLLDNSILNQCKNIANICNQADRCENSYFIDEEKNSSIGNTEFLPLLYCAFIDNLLVGFLATYIIDSKNVEICSFILPEYRRKGIASALLDSLLKDYEDFYIQVGIIKNNIIGRSFLKNQEFEYSSTECGMKLTKSQFRPISDTSLICNFKCNKEDRNIEYQLFINDDIIGNCFVYIDKTTAVIHDVEILNNHRGNGYSYPLMNYVLTDIFKEYDHILLHVTKENIPAYRLYSNFGFVIWQEIEYYYL